MNENRSFCSIPISVAQDMNLSLKAKGLYLLIQSCTEDPDFDSIHFKSALKAKCKESNAAFDSTWKELKSAGYLKQYRIAHNESEGFLYTYRLLAAADGSTPSL